MVDALLRTRPTDFELAPGFFSLASSHGLPSRREISLGDEFDAAVLTVYDVAVDYSKIITVEPGKRSGKPCIRGLRITVYDVLDYLASGMTHEQILRDFPYLTEDDIQACLAFAADRERTFAPIPRV